MRFFKIILLISLVTMIFSGCTETITTTNINQQTFDNSTIYDSAEQISFCQAQPKSIDDIIKKSYFIIRCMYKSKDTTQSSSMSYEYNEYVFEYIDAIRGNYNEKEITVIIYDLEAVNSSENNIFKLGEEYILFLEKHDNIFQGVRYTLHDGLCAHTDGNDIIEIYQRAETDTYRKANNGKETEFNDIEELKSKVLEFVKDIERNNEASLTGNFYTLAEDPAEIVKVSSYVVKAKIIENTTPNGANINIEEYKCETTESYKGATQDIFYVLVNVGSVTIGYEYLMMIECLGGSSYIISSNYSCILVDNEYMSYLD